MRMIWTIAAAALLTAPQAAAAPRKAVKSADPDRQICKSKPAIGSRLKRIRECHSAREWEEMELQEQLGMVREQINGDPGCAYEFGGTQCGIARGGRDTPW
ncbi:MAG TPA: hypothetical protein VEA61_12365 [Allosphingosinicella sp.]|nr:hypothetical protein [Allosphingosinicella sp.]